MLTSNEEMLKGSSARRQTGSVPCREARSTIDFHYNKGTLYLGKLNEIFCSHVSEQRLLTSFAGARSVVDRTNTSFAGGGVPHRPLMCKSHVSTTV